MVRPTSERVPGVTRTAALGRPVAVESAPYRVRSRRHQGEPVRTIGIGDRDLLATLAGEGHGDPWHRVTVRVDSPSDDNPGLGAVRRDRRGEDQEAESS